MKIEQAETTTKLIIPKGKPFKIIVLCITIATVLGLGYLFVTSKSHSLSTVGKERTATAAISDLSTTITGSGPIISTNFMNISAKTNGTITKIYYKQGDKVKAGALIAALDPTMALSNLQNAQNNLEQAELTQNQNTDDLKSLTSNAPIAGQITSLAVNAGDIVQKQGILYTITDTKNMKLTVPFNGSDIRKIKLGASAEVNLQNVMQSIKGRVTYINNAPYSAANGGQLYNVEISLVNPGTLADSTKASADVYVKGGTVSSADVGSLSYINKITVRSKAGGTVEKINARLYENVEQGKLVMSLINPDVNTAIQTTALKISGLKQQVTNSKTQLGYCNITAPISGTLTAIAFKEGETLTQGSVLTSVTDTSHMQFDVPVDELDIAKVKVGQNVDISVDALPETSTIPLTGKVKTVAVDGASTNGVTSYNVTIEITGVTDPRTIFARLRGSGNGGSMGQWGGQRGSSGNGGGTGNGAGGFGGYRNGGSGGNSNSSGMSGGFGGNWGNRTGGSGSSGGGNRMRASLNPSQLLSSLKDGMNANATILISENKGALAVPLESISRVNGKNYVMVKSDEATVTALKKSGKYIDIFNGSKSSNTNGGGYSNSQSGSSMGSSSSLLKQNEVYYKNAIPTEVQVGVNNDTSIQITSGLKAGDVVLLPPLVQGLSNSSSNRSGSGLGGMLGGGGAGFGGGGNRYGGNGGSGNRSGNGGYGGNSGSGGSNRSGGNGSGGGN